MRLYALRLAIFTALGGFMYGYDYGAINGVQDMVGFREFFNISYSERGNDTNVCDDNVEAGALIGLIVAIFSAGCLVGALLIGVLSDFAGRKLAIIIGGVSIVFGAALQGGSWYIWMLILGRVLAGLGVGALYMVVPIYVAEISPKAMRGMLVSFNAGLALSSGFLVGLVVSLVCNRVIDPGPGWRVILGLQMLFALVLTTGMIFLPESPRWLVKKRKDQKAAKILRKVHHNDERMVREELKEMKEAVRTQSIMRGNICQTLKALLTWGIIKRVLIGMTLQFFVGLPFLLYYTVLIFCKAGLDSYIASAAAAAINFLTNIPTMFLVDKAGRKTMLLVGSLSMTVTMMVAGGLLQVDDKEENQAAEYAVVALSALFLCSYSFAFLPIVSIVDSEIHPLEVRGMAMSITTSAGWIGNLLSAQLAPIMIASPLESHGTFYIFGGICFASFIFVLLALPETKGMSLEQINLLFSKPWLERTNIFYYLRCGCLWCCECRLKKITLDDVDDVEELHRAHESLENQKQKHDEKQPLLDGSKITLL